MISRESSFKSTWTAASWLQSLNIEKPLAAALVGKDPFGGDELALMKAQAAALPSVGALAEFLRSPSCNFAQCAAELLHPALQHLASGAIITGAELHGKFAVQAQQGEAFMLKYSDLSTFFGGLEQQIGSPEPKIMAAMQADHTKVCMPS